MADRVIIVGASRHGSEVPIGELKQMMGRAGRGHEHGQCRVDLIVGEDDEDYVREGLQSKTSDNISSVMSDEVALAFHVLPEICGGSIVNQQTAEAWHSRSFHSFLGGKVRWNRVFNELYNVEAIAWNGDTVRSLPLGDIAASCYFHAADVKAWKDNFSLVFELGLENEDLAIAWALGTVEVARRSGDLGKHRWVIEECRNNMPPGLEMRPGSIITTTLWWNVFGGPPVGKLKSQAIELREDFGRICTALVALDKKTAHWDMEDFFDSLTARAKRAIPAQVADLFMVPGMTKGKAMALMEMGITNRVELENALERSDLSEVFGNDVP